LHILCYDASAWHHQAHYLPDVLVYVLGYIGKVTGPNKQQGGKAHGLAEDVVIQKAVTDEILAQTERTDYLATESDRTGDSSPSFQ
jgi:hypothetical protein